MTPSSCIDEHRDSTAARARMDYVANFSLLVGIGSQDGALGFSLSFILFSLIVGRDNTAAEG
jgi:hypothetical protein